VANKDNILLHTDHSGLVKFGNTGQGDYPIIRKRITECVKNIKADIQRRFAKYSMFPLVL
jgi:hypothetical protein